MIAIDTKLLVYAHRRGLAEHRAAQRAIQRASDDARGWGIAIQSIAEFWSVVTHPSCVGGPSPPDSTRSFLVSLREQAGMQVWNPGAGFDDRLLQLASDLAVAGPRVFDLQIALTAFTHGAAELWRHDLGFVKIPGLRLVHRPARRAALPGGRRGWTDDRGHRRRSRAVTGRGSGLLLVHGDWPSRPQQAAGLMSTAGPRRV